MGSYPPRRHRPLTFRLESHREATDQENHQHQANHAAGGASATKPPTAEYQRQGEQKNK